MSNIAYRTQEGMTRAIEDIKHLMRPDDTRSGLVWTEEACKIWDITEEWVKIAWKDRGHIGVITDIAWMCVPYLALTVGLIPFTCLAICCLSRGAACPRTRCTDLACVTITRGRGQSYNDWGHESLC